MKFRKKPVTIDAVRWMGDNFAECKKLAGDNIVFFDGKLIVKTLEDGDDKVKAQHVASLGDWIIQGVAGEFYFCKHDIFLQTYEPEREL